MNLGQSILATGALIIITILAITTNKLIIQSQQDALRGQAYILAADIASSLMNEALKKSFDDPKVIHSLPYGAGSYHLYDNNFYSPTTDFTTSDKLGPSSSEATIVKLPDVAPFKSIAGYDDFDDYNGYSRTVDTKVITGFTVTSSVYYVQPTDLLTMTTSRTYYKRMTVMIIQPMYIIRPDMKPDTLKFSTLLSY